MLFYTENQSHPTVNNNSYLNFPHSNFNLIPTPPDFLKLKPQEVKNITPTKRKPFSDAVLR